ncbi:MAG: TetR/AcrR family transcriptional regulator C-terminal ligand-binding domain-containing protein [Actinomycetota bacterium]
MNPPRQVGRPPGPHEETLGKLLPAALRIFLSEGGAALTPTRLHRETGVSRATIYRNWPDPADLIEVMLQMATRLPEELTCTDDLRADLHLAMRTLLERFEQRPARAFFAACLEYGRRSEAVASTAEAFVAGILRPFHLVLAGGLDRGDIEGDLDTLVAEVAGPVILRHVVMGQTVTEAEGRAVVDNFCDHHLDQRS